MTSNVGNLEYFLPRNTEESDRLKRQHIMMKGIFGGTLIHPMIQLSPQARILESATGTGVWLRDIAELFPLAHLSGFDISDAQFPQTHLRWSANLFKHNVLTPLPKSLDNSFDFIHQRLVLVALKKEQWLIALKNLLAALKPGGWIQLVELEPWFSEETPSFKAANHVFGSLIKLGDKELHISQNGDRYLNAVGFTNINVMSCDFHVGGGAANRHGGQDFSDLSSRVGREMYAFATEALRALQPSLLDNEPFTSNAWLDRLEQDMSIRGPVMKASMILAQKPL